MIIIITWRPKNILLYYCIFNDQIEFKEYIGDTELGAEGVCPEIFPRLANNHDMNFRLNLTWKIKCQGSEI